MNTRFQTLGLTTCAGLAVFLCGCVAPRPQSFVDAEFLPQGYVGREHRTLVRGAKLVIEVSQIPGLNVARIDSFAQDGALYLSPFRISSGGNGKRQFEVDVSQYHLPDDWPEHVYWVVESYAYPFITAGFWSSAKQSPWVRKQVEIVKQ